MVGEVVLGCRGVLRTGSGPTIDAPSCQRTLPRCRALVLQGGLPYSLDPYTLTTLGPEMMDGALKPGLPLSLYLGDQPIGGYRRVD